MDPRLIDNEVPWLERALMVSLVLSVVAFVGWQVVQLFGSLLGRAAGLP